MTDRDLGLAQVLDDLQNGIAVEENFKRLFDWSYQPLHRFFVRRGFPREEALDLIQETFLRVYQGIKFYRRDASFKTWLFGIAANVWRNELRRSAASKRSGAELPVEATEADLPASGEPDALLDALSREQVGQLAAAIGALPPQMRRVMMLHSHGHPYGEIAEILGVAVETVKSHLARGRKRLRND